MQILAAWQARSQMPKRHGSYGVVRAMRAVEPAGRGRSPAVPGIYRTCRMFRTRPVGCGTGALHKNRTKVMLPGNDPLRPVVPARPHKRSRRIFGRGEDDGQRGSSFDSSSRGLVTQKSSCVRDLPTQRPGNSVPPTCLAVFIWALTPPIGPVPPCLLGEWIRRTSRSTAQRKLTPW